MLILGISGSPRKHGNTDTAVKIVLQKIEELMPCSTKFLRTHDLDIKPCTGCRYCMKGMECAIQNDDFHKLWQVIVKAKLIILGAPIFWNSPPGAMKNFIDRTHTWYGCPDKFPSGKKMGLISVAGDSGFESHEDIMTCWAKFYGIKIIGKERVLAREKGDIMKNSNTVKQLNDFALAVLKYLNPV